MKQTLKFFVAAFGLFVCLLSNAQVTTSSMSGKITDAKGPVAGAAIIAVYTPSGAQYWAISDENGNYRINAIIPGGPYSISVDLLGYHQAQETGVYAPLGETSIFNFELVEDAIALEAAVLVADSNESGMNIRRSGAGTTISQRRMESVPTVSRSMNDVMKLTPQASTTTSGFAVGGGNYRGSTVTVDGAAFNNAFGIGSNLPAGGSPISLDALEQMSISITPFDVRQSGFIGGAINAVTKSGSNDFHASVYNYYTSDKLQGSKAAGEDVPKTKSLNNTVGATVGGPVIKNKLFFFLNAEYTFDEIPGSSSRARTSASDAFGDKSQFNRPLASELDAIKSFLADKFNYDPGRYEGYSLKTPDYKLLARIDWNINRNNRFNIRFSHTHTFGSNQPSSSMSPLGGTNSTFVDANGNSLKFNRYSAGRQSSYALFYEAARYYQEQNFTSIAAELNTRMMDGAANNMVRVTWSHQDEPRSYVGDFFPTVDILSPDGVTGNDNTAIFTTIGIDPFTYGNLRDVQTVIATDEFSFSKGISNFVAGAQFEWNRAVNGFMQGGAGWFIYDSWDSFKNDVTNKSAAPVGFMITHANLDDPTKQTFPAFDYMQASLYAQDELNISDNFKLTAGVRLEMPVISIPTDNENKDFTAVANAHPNTSFAGLKTSDIPDIRVSVSPRIGFNWDVLKDRSFIVRGGTGIFTGRIPNVWLVSAIGNSNCLQYQYIANSRTGNPAVHFSNDRTEIINSIYSGNKFHKQDLSAPTATTIIARDLKMPSSWKSSLAFDFRLPGDIKATVEGLYNYNFNEVYATFLGYANSGSVQLPGEPKARDLWTSEGVKNNQGSGMNGYYVHNENDLHGTYYSVTAQLQKDFNSGLSLMAAYTRSSSKTLSDGNGDQISEFVNTYNVNGCNTPELGYSSYVTPNRVIASASYDIKWGKFTTTKLSAFYEGYNIGFISNYSYSRVSYLMNNVSGAGTAAQLIYIPTDAQLEQMPFADGSKSAFKTFIENDRYLSRHRGEYMQRNGATAPWRNQINARIAQDFHFNIAGKAHTFEVGLDVNNIGNLINSNWGAYKIMSSNNVLNYSNGAYKFTAPTWNTYNSLRSTWSMLLSARWYF
ncbi:MAG: TonB-dependent receptor [Bacteroidales bacterium]|nr:TonB-dependent receptor [Bacteroidales bacterium]